MTKIIMLLNDVFTVFSSARFNLAFLQEFSGYRGNLYSATKDECNPCSILIKTIMKLFLLGVGSKFKVGRGFKDVLFQ